MRQRQQELPPPRTYVTVQCTGTDRETGEARQWHHIVEDRGAAALVRRIEASMPGVRAEVRAG